MTFASIGGGRSAHFASASKRGFILVSGSVYDFGVDYRDISERIALLTQEIRDLQEIIAQDPKPRESTHRTNRASREARQLRLLQIKQELSRLMTKPP
jgi:hypothetical protein